MGLPMGCRLQKHLTEHNLHALHFANRNLSKGDPLKKLGGIPCQDITELVQACDVIWISASSTATPHKLVNRLVNVS